MPSLRDFSLSFRQCNMCVLTYVCLSSGFAVNNNMWVLQHVHRICGETVVDYALTPSVLSSVDARDFQQPSFPSQPLC